MRVHPGEEHGSKARAGPQLRALVRKNIQLLRRNRVSAALQMLAPVVLVAVFAAIAASVGDSTREAVPRHFEHTVSPAAVSALETNLGTVILGPTLSGAGQDGALAISALATRIGEALAEAGSGAQVLLLEDDTALETLIVEEEEENEENEEDEGEVCAVWFDDGGAGLARMLAEPSQLANGQLAFAVRCKPTETPEREPEVISTAFTLMVQQFEHESLSRYAESGFLATQALAQDAFAYLVSGGRNASATSYVTKFPQPEYKDNLIASLVQSTLSFFLVAALSFVVRFLSQNIVQEKEGNLIESMKIMGMYSSLNWLAWFLTVMVTQLPTVIVMGIIAKTLALFEASNIIILWIFFMLFVFTCVSVAFLISTLTNKAKTAASLATFLMLSANAPINAFSGDVTTADSGAASLKCLASILPPTGFSLGLGVIANRESDGRGVTWSNIGDDDFTMVHVLLILAFDALFFLFLAWYFDKVIAHDGAAAAQPPHFLFSPAYWRKSPSEPHEEELLSTGHDSASAVVRDEDEDDMHDGEPSVLVSNICKSFKQDGKQMQAVSNLSLDMYEGEVFALLGPNGAGKTTSINMLTGLLALDRSGDARIYGLSPRTQMDAIRQLTGLCPQGNMLVEQLTVKQHLALYAGIKGASHSQAQEAADAMLVEIGLADDGHVLAKDLSGGMKRKLCVGIAYIGDPKVVYLDEPTSGIDTASRRTIWDIIERHRAGRVTVLTTHSMDEADALADRIGIMATGRLRCIGSPLFLKRHYGVGYNLAIVRGDVAAKTLEKLVVSHIDDASVVLTSKTESHFALPFSSVSNFPDLLDELDKLAGNGDGSDSGASSDAKIRSYNLAMTTMEQVFVSIANAAQLEQEDASDADDGGSTTQSSSSTTSSSSSSSATETTTTASSTSHSTANDGMEIGRAHV